MAKIYGQIESLKKLRIELRSHGINRFNSIKEINDFLCNFKKEQEETINNQREILQDEINNLNLRITENQAKCEILKRRTITEIEVKLDTIKHRIDLLSDKVNRSFIHRLFYYFSLRRQKKLQEYYSTNSHVIVIEALKVTQKIINKDENDLKQLIASSELIISERSAPEIQKLNDAKKTIESLHPLIAGAIGENLVVKEIEKLPNDFILINDYNLRFYPPIYNRKNKDKIFSIQIDHLLISKSGIYILETKNWSKKSVESLDLRSPVDQINRTNYALFTLINNADIRLNEHHWGDKQIPIKSIIVMINEKPKEDFKFVKVKSLKELNTYLTYFEPLFSEKEVDRIAEFLINMQTNSY
jgi:hypothetical protein